VYRVLLLVLLLVWHSFDDGTSNIHLMLGDDWAKRIVYVFHNVRPMTDKGKR